MGCQLACAGFVTGLVRNSALQWRGLDRTMTPSLGADGGSTWSRPPSGRSCQGTQRVPGASRIFLIDWNKARKPLRTWVSKCDAFDILDWAARNRCGHSGRSRARPRQARRLGGADPDRLRRATRPGARRRAMRGCGRSISMWPVAPRWAGTIHLGPCGVVLERADAELAEVARWRQHAGAQA